jgi:hypothetical protein
VIKDVGPIVLILLEGRLPVIQPTETILFSLELFTPLNVAMSREREAIVWFLGFCAEA